MGVDSANKRQLRPQQTQDLYAHACLRPYFDHLRRRNDVLARLLEADEVACHPFIVGELACGSLKNRQEILSLLAALPSLSKVDDDEVLVFIDRHRLMGQGLGLIDVHLLASCRLTGVPLWTRDARLAGAAAALELNKDEQGARGD